MRPLSDRQTFILSRVVEAHIETALPVGSRFLTERFEMPCSPATVRHEMGALEDIGYLTHPHTSSGRIPTSGGYRYYVDHCLEDTAWIPQGEVDRLQRELRLTPGTPDLYFWADKASRLLSVLSEEVGLVVFEGEAASAAGRRVGVHGASHLFKKPEFQDLERVRPLFATLDDPDELLEFIRGRARPKIVTISIGEENRVDGLEACTVITAAYAGPEDEGGSLTLIGPMRMDYRRGQDLVRTMARAMEEVLLWRRQN